MKILLGKDWELMSRRPKRHVIDFYLFLSIICLLVIGMLMVFSASSVSAYNQYNNPYYFFQRQLIWAVLGIAGKGYFFKFIIIIS
jgi:cell division protein FtsW